MRSKKACATSPASSLSRFLVKAWDRARRTTGTAGCVELFHQQALAADRAQHLQYAVDEAAHRAQRMVSRDALLHRDVAPHRSLLVAIVTAHAHLRRGGY